MRQPLLATLASALACWAAAQAPAAAQEADRYAAILVDATSGEVLHASRADQLRRPASLTKLMTLYIAFEEIEAGRLGLGDMLRVSERAAETPPVELGLEAGETIRVLDAMKALIVRSANDAAVVLAERIGGDEAAFAERMTETAHGLGMTRTRFMNASGLPHDDQLTTARDIARLAAALRTDYPEYYPLFEVRRLEWNGRVIGTHNAILDLVEGADGLKTGYTDASGYNLAASAVRARDSLIAIVMGGPDAMTRDAHVALLLERGFEELADRRERGQIITVAEANPQQRRLQIILDAEQAEIDAAAYAPRENVETAPLAPVNAPPQPGSALDAAQRQAQGPREAQSRPSGWRVQVGAFHDYVSAEARLDELAPMVAGQISQPIKLVTPVIDMNPVLYRAQLVGFADRAAADAACNRLEDAGAPCFVVSP
ncbi:MAG: D-alanyl-D-alanine carboxypeptidase [Maricaulaceae bacterium]